MAKLKYEYIEILVRPIIQEYFDHFDMIKSLDNCIPFKGLGLLCSQRLHLFSNLIYLEL